MKIKMTKGSAIACFVIALVLLLVCWLPNIAHGTLGFVAPVSGGALGYDLVPALAWLLFIYNCQNLFRNFPVAAKKAGIAVMVIGALIALAARLDGGLVVGVIGYILFNPNILDKIRARRTSTASESEAPKTSDGIVPEVSVLPTSGKPADTHLGGKSKARTLIASAVLGILGASYAAYAYQNRKSRDEALQWMQDFLPEHGGDGGSDPLMGQWRTSYTLKSEGCLITLIDSEERRNNPNFHDHVVTYRFSLADLDPTRIKTNEFDALSVSIETHDKRSLIHMYDEAGEYPNWSFGIVFHNKDDAERFAKALQRAVILCGGKASKF